MKKILFLIFFILNLFANEKGGITFYNSFEVNSSKAISKRNDDFIFLSLLYHIKSLDDSFESLRPKIDIAIVVDKKVFKKYLPSLINSVNTYFLNKNLSYKIKIFNKNAIKTAVKNYKNVIVYSTDANETLVNEFNNTNFYFPAINKNDLNFTADNIYFGGIDYNEQIKKLSSFITEHKAVAIISNTLISQKLLSKEQKLFDIKKMKYHKINYPGLKNKFIFFDTSAGKTAQILSSISNKNITTKLNLSSQINFDPLLITLTQPQDVEKLIIANSLLNIPTILEDYNQILNSDIKYNWLNYSTNILLNKIYNESSQGDKFYMNDFDTYIFNNQINYKTKIYQIIQNSFREVY